MEEDVYTNLLQQGCFQAFCSSIKLSGLEEALRSPGPWTVFAPTDSAFRRLPHNSFDLYLRSTEEIVRFVSFHILPGYLTTDDLRDMYGRVRIQGKRFTLSHGRMKVEGIPIVKPAIRCRNGVLQPIGAVILPTSVKV